MQMNVFYILSCAICHLIALLSEKTKGRAESQEDDVPCGLSLPWRRGPGSAEYIIRPNLQYMDSTGWNRGKYEVVKRLASNA